MSVHYDGADITDNVGGDFDSWTVSKTVEFLAALDATLFVYGPYR